MFYYKDILPKEKPSEEAMAGDDNVQKFFKGEIEYSHENADQLTKHSQGNEKVTSDHTEAIPCEHQSSAAFLCLDCDIRICALCCSTTHNYHRNIRTDISLKLKEVLSAVSQCAKENLSKIQECHNRKFSIIEAEEDIKERILIKVSVTRAQLGRFTELLLMQLGSRKTDKLKETESVLESAKSYQKKLTNLQGIFHTKESLDKNYKILENPNFLNSLFKERDVYIQQPIPSFDMVFLEKETMENLLGKLKG